jgi:DNA-directed RNA polymerase beta subunit
MLLKEQIGTSSTYEYKVEVYIGGENGDKLKIGTPSLESEKWPGMRVLFPNEARLRNLTYQSLIQADV